MGSDVLALLPPIMGFTAALRLIVKKSFRLLVTHTVSNVMVDRNMDTKEWQAIADS